MTGSFHSFLSPKLSSRPRPGKGGCGVFVVETVQAGELLTLWGGRVLAEAELDPSWPNFTRRVLQIEEGLYLLSPEALEPADCFNHSCEPTAGMSGQIGLVAMRELAPGEEVCFDYAMSDGSGYDEFTCECGTPGCRGQIRGDDWARPELWQRYAGFFMPYLQRRIERLKAQEAGQERKTLAA